MATVIRELVSVLRYTYIFCLVMYRRNHLAKFFAIGGGNETVNALRVQEILLSQGLAGENIQ
jgi:hypothetical protein